MKLAGASASTIVRSGRSFFGLHLPSVLYVGFLTHCPYPHVIYFTIHARQWEPEPQLLTQANFTQVLERMRNRTSVHAKVLRILLDFLD